MPDLIAQLREADWDEAVEELLTLLVHNGLYPATSAALPLLAEVAVDPEARGRLGALELLTSFGAELARQAPDTLAELGRSARPLLPLASDPDPEVRIALYEYACSWLGSGVEEQAREMLRNRFAAEPDLRAQVALMEPLGRYGLLTAADLDTLLARGRDEVVFAAAWSALASGLELPAVVDHLVRLWPGQASAYPGSGAGNSLNLLVTRLGAASVPVLQRLGAGSAAAVGDLATAWLRLAEMSRAATTPALDAVIGLASSTSVVSVGDAVRVVEALSQLRPAAGERASEMADAVADLLVRQPAAPALQASSAALLFALGDLRWTAPALAVAATAEPAQVGEGSSRMSLAAALAGLPGSRLPVDWAEDDLIAVTAQAISVRPEAAAAWAEVLHLLPPSSAVVDVLLSASDRGAVAMTLAHLAQAEPKSFTEDARAAVAALPISEDETGAALLTAQALLADDFAAFGRVWELGGSGFGADELLRIWTRYPSAALEAACRSVLTGAVATSIPARHRQLVAAEYLVDTGDPLAAWPTVRALVDRAGEPLVPAAALAARIAGLEPALVPEWTAQLRDIVERGRQTWAGPDYGAVAVAAGHLLELGELSPEAALERVLTAELDAVAAWQAGPVTPVVSRVLSRTLALRPHLRPLVSRRLTPLTSADARIPAASNVIAADTRLTTLLHPFV